MRKYITVFFSGLLLLFACSKTPAGIIKPDKMADVLTDMHIADGAMIGIPQIPDSSYRYGMGKFVAIFKKWDVDSAQFRTSYQYYTVHPDELVSIYDEVLKKLSAKSDSLTGLIARNNTSQTKSAKPSATAPVKPARPGYAPPQQGQPSPSMQPGKGLNSLPAKEQSIERMRMHRDSLLKSKFHKANAVPVK